MSKLDSLTQRILDDAKEKADSILSEADRKSKELLDAKVREAEASKEKLIERATSEAAMIKDRVVSSAELKVRDEKLTAKQEMLDKVFSMAKDRLKELDDSQYKDFLDSTLKQIEIKGTGTLMVPSSKKAVAEGVVKSLSVVVDEKIESGFMIKDDDIIYNYTFDSLVDDLRDQIEAEIAIELFKELE
ncbi:MAG: V-type ATP synthase subunit E [Gudongella sp.]|jgi:V/A-type H+-transporting ATPase subunit E|nr:V-type ATP synthase subunit E [Gudongella sp.]